MKIVVNLDVVLAKRKMTITELSEEIGISVPNLSIFRSNKAGGVRFTTLALICKALDCKPGDILDVMEDDEYRKLFRLDKIKKMKKEK